MVELYCGAWKGSPPILYRFYHEDNALGSSWVYNRGGASFKLPLSAEHSGKYACEADNGLGAWRSETVSLDVKGELSLPTWASFPTRPRLCDVPGCVSHGSPVPFFPQLSPDFLAVPVTFAFRPPNTLETVYPSSLNWIQHHMDLTVSSDLRKSSLGFDNVTRSLKTEENRFWFETSFLWREMFKQHELMVNCFSSLSPSVPPRPHRQDAQGPGRGGGRGGASL